MSQPVENRPAHAQQNLPYATASSAPPLPSAPIAPQATSASLALPRVALPTAPAPRVKRKGAVGDAPDVHAKKARPAGGGYLDPFAAQTPTPLTSLAPNKPPPIDPQLLRENPAVHAPIIPDSDFSSQGSQSTTTKGDPSSQPHVGPSITPLDLRVPASAKPQTASSTFALQTPLRPRAAAAIPPLPSRAPTPSRNTPSLPAAPVTVTAMPKAVRDKLSAIEDRMDHLESSRTSFAPAGELASLRARITTLEEANQRSVEDNNLALDGFRIAQSALAATVDAHTQELAAWLQHPTNVGMQQQQREEGEDTHRYQIKSEVTTAKVKSEPGRAKEEKEQNNLFNAAMRSAFLSAMALPAGTKNKSLALPIPVDGGGWVARSLEYASGSTVNVNETSQVLRPDWAKPWSGNTGWHDRLVEFARAKVPQIQPAITTQFMLQKSDAELDSRMKTVYKAMRHCWQANQNLGSDVLPARAPARTAAEQTIIGKRKSRKARKGMKRREALANPENYDQASTHNWLWLVQDCYTSTDESGGEVEHDAIDPTSDDEKVGKQVPNRVAPWITRPPMYRGSNVAAFIEMLDDAVAVKAAGIGKVPHARVKGERKDVALPRFSNKDAAFRIPRWAVDPAWLAAHPKEEIAISMATPPSAPLVAGPSTSRTSCAESGEGLDETNVLDEDEGDDEWELQNTTADEV
ncbi:hypothetical protein EV121DRAFT_297581 [Schizophyllum commune]